VLLVLKTQATKGGCSRVTSAVSIYNEMLKSHPHLVPLLFNKVDRIWEGENGFYSYPPWCVPVAACKDQLMCDTRATFSSKRRPRIRLPLSGCPCLERVGCCEPCEAAQDLNASHRDAHGTRS
jgi:hypothetical protein